MGRCLQHVQIASICNSLWNTQASATPAAFNSPNPSTRCTRSFETIQQGAAQHDGLGEVIASRHPDVAVGERLFGCFPMATHLVIEATDVGKRTLRDGAAKEVGSAKEAIDFARSMIADESARKAMGDRGRATVAENRGASERTAQRIVELLA